MKPMPTPDSAAAGPGLADVMAAQRTDMAAQRTELAFQRNRFAADQTLLAIMRAALSMIGLGFTIFALFQSLAAREAIGESVADRTPGHFGLALVVLGVLLLVAGIAVDMRYKVKLRRQYRWIVDSEWSEGLESIDRSLIAVSAIALLLVGIAAVGVILARI